MNPDIDSVATVLEAGDVPVEVGLPRFAEGLMSNADVIFQHPNLMQASLLVCTAATGTRSGVGMDIPQAFTAAIFLASGDFAKWIRSTSLEAASDVVNHSTKVLDALDRILREEHSEAKNMREDRTPNMLSVLFGSKEDLERNAHSEPREPIGTAVVDWTAAITLGKLRDFYASLVRTVYFNGNASAATRLLNVMFGSGYMGDSNSVTLTRGSKAGRYGALAGFQFAAPPAAAAMALRKWETLANKGLGNEGQQSVLYCQQVFELVNSVPSKYGHEESYGLKLSDAFVSDACVSKLVAGVHLAATNASQDGDPNKSAKVVAMSLHLAFEDARFNSHMYWRTVGEIGTKALSGNIVDGRNFPMWSAKALVIKSNAYLYVEGLDEGETARESVAGLVAMKLKLPRTAVEVAAPRIQRNATFDGTVALSLSNSALKALLSLGNPVPGTTNEFNAVIDISALEAASVMVGPETNKIYAAVSLSLLKDAVLKAGEEINERRRPGAGGGDNNSAAEIAALREQFASEVQVATDRQIKLEEAMANMTAQNIADNNTRETERVTDNDSRKQEAAEQRDMVNKLERNASIAHDGLRRAQEDAARDAKQAALEAKLAAAHNTEMLAAMQADSNALKGVFIKMIEHVPGLAAVMGGHATLTLGNAEGGGVDASPELVSSSYKEVMEQLEGTAAKRARAEEGGEAPAITEEEVASAVLEEQLRLVQLSKKAAKAARADARAAAKAAEGGDEMRVDDGGAQIEYRKPCGYGSKSLGHDIGLHGNGYNGSAYYDRPLSDDTGEQQGENEHEEQFNVLIFPLMVWLIIVTFVYARRTARLLGRRFASVHKARRRVFAGICDRRSVNVPARQWLVLLVAVIFYGLSTLCNRHSDAVSLRRNELLLVNDFGGTTNFQPKDNFHSPKSWSWNFNVTVANYVKLRLELQEPRWPLVDDSRYRLNAGRYDIWLLPRRTTQTARMWRASRRPRDPGKLVRFLGRFGSDVEQQARNETRAAAKLVPEASYSTPLRSRDTLPQVSLARPGSEDAVKAHTRGGEDPCAHPSGASRISTSHPFSTSNTASVVAPLPDRVETTDGAAGLRANLTTRLQKDDNAEIPTVFTEALTHFAVHLLAIAFVTFSITTGRETRPHCRRPHGKGGHRKRGAAARSEAGSWWTLCVLLVWTVAVDAAGEEGQERVMLFNTRGLAVSMSAAGVLFFARTALTKLAFIVTQIHEKLLDAGALLELICSRAQAKLLRDWFRSKGFGFKMLAGDTRDRLGMVRNGVAIFYSLAKYKPVVGTPIDKYRKCASDSSPNAATRLGDRILCLSLTRRDMSIINLVAWHGRHDEPGFAVQMDAIEDVGLSAQPALILGDVNRRACVTQASRTSPLNSGDKRWRDCTNFRCDCCAASVANVTTSMNLVTLLNEREDAATRRAVVGGKAQWSVLDRALEVGREKHKWQLAEIVWAEVPGDGTATISDHAAVCYERPVIRAVETAEGRPVLPSMKAWKEFHHKQFEELTEGITQRAADACGEDPSKVIEFIDAELLDAAETVEQGRTSRNKRHEGHCSDNHSLCELWRWRLKSLQDVRLNKGCVFNLGWLRHPKCTLRHDLAHHVWIQSVADVAWQAMVKRCRKEITFYERIRDVEKKDAARFMAYIASAELEEDAVKRVGLAHQVMRGLRGPQEKLAYVAVDDDPNKGFVYEPAEVREAVADIGQQAQNEYKDDNVAPECAFEAFMEHFMDRFEELGAPDGGGAFDLSALLTFELFEDTLFSYSRYKSVGAKVSGAVSSLELIRRLSAAERKSYFEVAKECIVGRELPGHWKEMVFILLKKKHGDQRKVRKMREIALMDQMLKLMLKCVKKLSFDRMVGRTGSENHGWVPGHGALNAALMMDAILGQSRELRHDIFMLFLDLKQFFPAIKRKSRKVAEYFIGLPHEVIILAVAVFEKMRARFDTAHGLSNAFEIVAGDLMGCVLSPSHARCLLTAISVAIAATSSGVRVWGCEKQARQVAQTMMADDWAGFNTSEASLQAQWGTWVDYALASGSPIGVAGLEKTVVTAASFRNGKWTNVSVKLRVPRVPGGMVDLPEFIPQLPFDEAYPHMGLPRSIGGDRKHMMKKLRKGVMALVSKLRKIKLDRGQHIRCANCLKGSYVGYYAAAYGLTMGEAEALEKLWRTAFRCVFKLKHSTPVAHFYGGTATGVADSLHGKHVIVDAVGSLFNTCRRALAAPEDSRERAVARSALARRARGWGCSTAPTSWLGSDEHLAAAVVMEKSMEAKGAKPEAFDFFLLYVAWLTVQDRKIARDLLATGETPPPRRQALAMEHDDDAYGEAIANESHSAWANGTSGTLFSILGRSAPVSLISAGIIRIEHLCRPSDKAAGTFEFTPFNALAKAWGLALSRKGMKEWEETVAALRAISDAETDSTQHEEEGPDWWQGASSGRSTVRTLSSKQLWDGTRCIAQGLTLTAGWPLGDLRQSLRKGEQFRDMLCVARASGVVHQKQEWADALTEAYGPIERQPAVEWRDGAPTDIDKYGTRVITLWPGADYRTGGDCKIYGSRTADRDVAGDRDGRAAACAEWDVNDDGDLTIAGRPASRVDARHLPCVRLLLLATQQLKDKGATVDRQQERTIRSAGEWAVHVESSRQMMHDWATIHEEHDIQFAAATDGGRQAGDEGAMVASAAAFRDDGMIVGGALDPIKLARSSYEAELQALIDVLTAWPANSRVLIAMDARSPVQSLCTFRRAHVNKRAEYLRDDMLDELLRQVERMDTVVFYWLRGHSGAAPNEVADWYATEYLQESVGAPISHGTRRHASMTFAFDCKPFKWAATRITRHVRELTRARSHRTEWLDDNDWSLTWKKSCNRVRYQKVLQLAQTKRLLLGDEAFQHGALAIRAGEVRCHCGLGPCSTEHWLFECRAASAVAHRSTLLHEVRRAGRELELLNGGVEHGATLITARTLMGDHSKGSAERKVALRWLVGCIPKPLKVDKDVRSTVVEALEQSARCMAAAREAYSKIRDDFVESERLRSVACRFASRWRRRAALGGPISWAKALPRPLSSAHFIQQGTGGSQRTWRQVEATLYDREVRWQSETRHWVDSRREWHATIVIMMWMRKMCARRGDTTGASVSIKLSSASLLTKQHQFAICTTRSGKPGKLERKEAGAKRARDKAKAEGDLDRQVARFSVLMGLEGDGIITLAEGLVDVDVNFKRARRVQWRARTDGGNRRKRSTRAGDNGNHSGSGGSYKRRTQGGAAPWYNSDSDDSDDEVEGTDEAMADAGERAQVTVGGALKIFWTEDKVWFRCDVTKLFDGGREVEVEYRVPGWPAYRHRLADVKWEHLDESEDVDEAEIEYDHDDWMGPVDHEAARAAAGANQRGTVEGRARRSAGGVPGHGHEQRDAEEPDGPNESGDDDEEWTETRRGRKGKATEGGGSSTDSYSWILTRLTRGVGAKKRKALANCLIGAWRECKDGPDVARIDMKELYRRVSRMGLTAAAVGVELKAMAKDGLVILRHDAVFCGVQKPTADAGLPAATTHGGTTGTEVVTPIGSSAAQPNPPPLETRKSGLRRLLGELFDLSSDEGVSLHLLRQRVHPQIPTEEIIAVLKELDEDGYIMYRDEAGAINGPEAHLIG